MLTDTPYASAIDKASNLLAEAMLDEDTFLREAGRGLDHFLLELLRGLGQQLLTELVTRLGQRMAREARRRGLRLERSPTITVTTLFGPITVPSPYLRDPNGQLPSSRPLKDDFGLIGNSFTDAVERAMTDFGAERSFSGAAKAFKEHYGSDIDRSVILRKTEALGEQAAEYVATQFSEAEEMYDKPPVERDAADVLLTELDGCHLPTARFMTAAEARAEGLELARPDAADNEVVRIDAWVEARTGIVRGLDEEDEDKLYVCQKASYEEVCQQLFGAACMQGLGPQTRVIAPGDGANGLREGLELVFPNLEFRLDPTHLKDNLYKCAAALGLGDGARQGWVRKHLDAVWAGQVEAVLSDLKTQQEQADGAEHQEALGRMHKYLEDHKDAVDYARYKAEKTPMGSGEVESAHRYVPQERLKIAAARWRRDHLNPMLALRVLRANGWWENFWQHESERRRAAA